jgi:hypothetical protein
MHRTFATLQVLGSSGNFGGFCANCAEVPLRTIEDRSSSLPKSPLYN